jgi:hypothetical protein
VGAKRLYASSGSPASTGIDSVQFFQSAFCDNHGDGGADGAALADAGDDSDAIRLDLHAAAAAKTLLPAPKFAIDEIEGDGDARGQACQSRDETFTVRFPCCFETKHVGESFMVA